MRSFMNALQGICYLIGLAASGAIALGNTSLTQPDIYYVCVTSTSDISGLPAIMETFAKAHAMSFKAGPLNPAGTSMAIEMKGLGATIFVTNSAADRELYITIECNGDRQKYLVNVRKLNSDVMQMIEVLKPLIVEWRRLPENYIVKVPAAANALRGPAL